MKKLLLLLLLAAPGYLFAQKNDTYHITGTLHNANVKHVYLRYSTGEVNVPAFVDSAVVVNGAYTFTGHIQGCTFATLKTDNDPKTFGFFLVVLAPETFTITHDVSFTNGVITGSRVNSDFTEMNAKQGVYQKAINALNTDLKVAKQTSNETSAQALQAKIDGLENEMMDKVYAGYVRNNPGSPLALYALTRYAVNGHSIDVKKAEPLFNLLPAEAKNTIAGREMQKQINYTKVFNAKSTVGMQAQEFMLRDTSGKPVKLSAYKGKYVLVDFWASWCGPCRADNPHLKIAYQKYHSKGFDILSVSLDVASAKAKWMKAIHDDKIEQWTHVADLEHPTNTVVTLYGLQAIPQNFLIDPNGKIIAMSLRGGLLEDELGKIFKD